MAKACNIQYFIWGVWIVLSSRCCAQSRRSACLPSRPGDSWPRSHSSWSLPSELTQFVVPADSSCVHSVGPEAHVSLLPPAYALVTANGSTQLPASCCHLQRGTPQPQHKVAPALWSLIEFLDTDADLVSCDPLRQASHKCAVLHPEHQQRLVAFEAHLQQAQHFSSNMSAAEADLSNTETAKAAAEEWHPILQEFLAGAPVAMQAQQGLLIVYVPPRHLAAAVTAVARQPEVAHVLPRRVHFLHNLRDVSLQIQAGSPAVGAAAAADAQFWGAGVNGSGQVIGVGDSGIDMEHCAFADPAVPFDSFTVDRSRVPVFRSTEHRKVALYYMFADGLDDSGGHGTHVSGILAANPQSSSQHQGVAPAAKLAFFDLGATSVQAWISAPVGLDSRYFPVTYEAGARVHSDSWGSNAVHYDADAMAVDAFSHKNQDFLSVFSAGNFGTLQSAYETTVNSPALAKNSLAIGNARPTGISFGLPRAAAGFVGELEFAVGAVQALRMTFVAGEFSSDWGELSGAEGMPVASADPIEACTELADPGTIDGALVLVARGSCAFDVKADLAARAGARAVIVGNDEAEYVVMQRASAGQMSIPVGLIPRPSYRFLQSLLQSGQAVTATFAGEFDMAGLESSESMDESSSRGPTADGRIKPDLAAPGTITAAKSLTACGVSPKSGTSMAAPVVAASATLVRQYFADGFYPGGAAGQGVKHTASGPLIKAVLIGGAAHMRGFSGSSPLPMAVPSPVQGWGRVDLAGSLPLQGGSTVANMQIVDLAELTEAGEAHVFCLDAQPGRLSVTLVWHDPPASPAAASLLVNDLDLEVRVAELGGARLYSQGAPHPDRVNNVERVVLEQAPPGTVAISVQAHRLASGPQKYALVVQGAFSGILQHEKNPALLDQGVSNEECVVLAAEIDLTPDPLTADGDPAFTFSSLTGVMPALGFECQLQSSNDAGAPAWQACQSPKQYSGLQDGEYTFFVRISGEDLADSFEFVVDKSPPETEIVEDFGYDRDSALAISLPPPVSGLQVAAFAMSSVDRSSVQLTCKLSGPAATALLPPNPTFAVNTEYNCTSPQVFSITAAGSYELSVFGTDSVGNWEKDPVVHAFAIEYAAGAMYTRISGPSWGASQNRTHTFELEAIQGTPNSNGAAPAVPVAFEYSVGTLSQAGAQDPAWLDTAWAAVNGSQFTHTEDEDGEVRVRVRTVAQGSRNVTTLWRLSIDSTPPKITFRKDPPAVLLTDAVIIQVTADEEGVEWQCALIDGNFSVVAAELLAPCRITAAGLIEYGAQQGSGRNGSGGALADGKSYTFAVRALDAVGNASPTELRHFLVDLSAPEVRGLSLPNATRAESVEVEFAVTDGPAGTGVESVECGLRWLGNSPDSETRWEMCNQTAAPEDDSVCSGCSWYSHEIETAEQGIWGFSVRTRDGANQTNATAEASIVIDRNAPQASWATAGIPRNPAPPNFQLRVEAIDQGAYKSGVQGGLCAVMPEGEVGDSQFQKQTEADVLLLPLAGQHGIPRFDYTDPTMRQRRAAFGAWFLCALPVQVRGVPSGTYRFDVRPVDNAGNVGPALSTNITVQASLAPDAALAKGGEKRSMETWVLGLLVAGGVLACAVAAGIAIWASRRRRRSPSDRGQPHVGTTHDRRVTVIRLSDSEDQSPTAPAVLAKQDEMRLNQALELSMLEAGVHASRAQHRDDTALELAIQASLNPRSPR